MVAPNAALAAWENGYFNWLCEQVACPPEYRRLLKILDSVEFEWRLPMDQNRAVDGFFLRDEYGGGIHQRRIRPCSVLEMLVGVFKRADDFYTLDLETSMATSWFWECVGNLGLLAYTDEGWDPNIPPSWDEDRVYRLVRMMVQDDISRYLFHDGKVKLGPVDDIWTELARWVCEVFPGSVEIG